MNATHGGKRKGAGRPATTGTSVTPVVSFRLSAEDYARAMELSDGHVNGYAHAAMVRALRRPRKRKP